MKVGDRVHLYWRPAYNQRGRIVACSVAYMSVLLDSGRTVEGVPYCDAELIPPVPMVSPLPGVLRGVREVADTLKWPQEFIRTWMDAPSGGTVPRLPWYAAGDSQVFLTVECLEWLAKHWPGGPEVKRKRGGQMGVRRKVSQ